MNVADHKHLAGGGTHPGVLCSAKKPTIYSRMMFAAASLTVRMGIGLTHYAKLANVTPVVQLRETMQEMRLKTVFYVYVNVFVHSL
jgi:hypothetical protein